MAKKSLVVVRPVTRKGATPLFGGASTTNAALRIITLRSGMSELYSACASRYVSSGGGSSGWSSLQLLFGSQLSSVTEYSTSLRAAIGLPDIRRYTVSVVMHTPTPTAIAPIINAVNIGLRRRLLMAMRK